MEKTQQQSRQISEFEINDLLPIALTFVVVGIGVAYGLQVLGDLKTDFVGQQAVTATCNTSSGVYTGCGVEYNATQAAVVGVGKIPNKLPLIATVVVAAVIIGILVRYLFLKFN